MSSPGRESSSTAPHRSPPATGSGTTPAGIGGSRGVQDDRGEPPSDGRPIVFFDGVCGLCNRFVDFALSRDRERRLLFAPLQGETARRILADAELESLKTVVFVARGRADRRSSAVVRVLWQLGGWWSIVGTLVWLVPKPLRDLGYRLVARYRYRWFGQNDACRMPTADEREQFLA